MTRAEQLATFVAKASYEDLSLTARQALKHRILDALGCAIGALRGEPLKAIRAQVQDFGGTGHCTLLGGGSTAPDRAAFYNSALVRYLDFNDSYLASDETCHPSDNFGSVLAAAEYADRNGRALLTALAVAYQVQCRLSDVAPVRAKGFDHTTQGSYAVAAGVSNALGMDLQRTANAIAICGTAFNALRVTRTGLLSQWKGLAYPNLGFASTHATFLAMRGVTGPMEVFEGNKGFMESIAGPFEIDWSREDLERVTQTVIKRFNAEMHSQATIEGILELKAEYSIDPAGVDEVDIGTFDVAYNIIGGGEEGAKTFVTTKEQADHSLQYMVAVALLDGQLMPPQYALDRIMQTDVQSLLRRVFVHPVAEFSRRFPVAMPCTIAVKLRDGRILVKQKDDYEGFLTRPMRWETLVEKFERLTQPYIDEVQRKQIIDAVLHLDTIRTKDLTGLLGSIKGPA